jgi:hypothetical protein
MPQAHLLPQAHLSHTLAVQQHTFCSELSTIPAWWKKVLWGGALCSLPSTLRAANPSERVDSSWARSASPSTAPDGPPTAALHAPRWIPTCSASCAPRRHATNTQHDFALQSSLRQRHAKGVPADVQGKQGINARHNVLLLQLSYLDAT